MTVLVFNGGSTGWKIAAYDDVGPADAPVSAPSVEVELSWRGDGPDDARIEVVRPGSGVPATVRQVRVARGHDAIATACDDLRAAGLDLARVAAVGHRIVHGGSHFDASVIVDDAVEAALRELEPLAPEHNPLEREAIDAARALFPGVPQVAVFDTVFHRTLPPAAYVFPGPYAWRERGIRRFGFHGPSVAYCVERAAQLLARDTTRTHLIVAHLGGGCSVTAVRDGASVDTSMGFTPLDGTMMATRSGAIDPSVLTYLMRERAANGANAMQIADELEDALEHHAGLLGISGVSGDLRDVERAADAGDARAELAREMFAHRAAATIAAASASLERVDALVFTGGVGSHAAAMRARICARLRPLGIAIDPVANAAATEGDARFEASGPAVVAIATHEAWYVARECARVLRANDRYLRGIAATVRSLP